MSYRHNIHNHPPPPCYYVLHLSSTNAIRSSGTSWWWRINLPDVSSAKQYFIRPTKVYLQDLNPADANIRAVVLKSETCRLQNSHSTGLVSGDSAGYSNIIGVCELQHSSKNANDYNFVAHNEEPHYTFLSGGFVNGGALQNNEFNIRICDLNNADIPFNSSAYADAFFEISLFEIYNPQYTITNEYKHDKLQFNPASTTQVQGRV